MTMALSPWWWRWFGARQPPCWQAELLFLSVSCVRLAPVSVLGPQKQPPLLPLPPARYVRGASAQIKPRSAHDKAGRKRRTPPPCFYLFTAPFHAAASEMQRRPSPLRLFIRCLFAQSGSRSLDPQAGRSRRRPAAEATWPLLMLQRAKIQKKRPLKNMASALRLPSVRFRCAWKHAPHQRCACRK